ncbi:MAG: hypothetical protein SFV51_29620 [Bryobacteraceae bacterium]|nr:hypothetical protein [Bryobacteraceae bacterium]
MLLRAFVYLAAGSAFGQTTVAVEGVRVGVATQPASPGGVHFIASHAEAGPLVKGAPYTAEAETETTRILADGTRIVHKNKSSMARDKDGRTRRENSLESVGPWATAGQQPPRIAHISDPGSGETILLDLNAKTARRIKAGQTGAMHMRMASPDGKRVVEERVQVAVREKKGGSAAEPAVFSLAVPPPHGSPSSGDVLFFRAESKNAKKESLGRQTMEGVMVEGTRETVTIPAGEIGNDRPIVSVTERWHSPELQITILTKTNDPQFGESVYRVSNLRRGEPSPDLFRVPADFKVTADFKTVEDGGPGMRWIQKAPEE